MVSIKVSGLLVEWGHGVWRSFLKALWKDPPLPPPFQPFQAITMCVFARVCVSDWVQALLGFSGVWTAGRVVLIGQNDAEMDRKPPLSSWSSFSLSLTFTPSLHFNHSLIFSTSSPPPPFCSCLHQERSAYQPWLSHNPSVAPLIFHIPLFLPFGLFPKSTLSQRGEAFSRWLLLHSNFSLFCSFFCYFHKSFFHLNTFFPPSF